MTFPRPAHTPIFSAVLFCALVQTGCTAEGEPSSTTSGYVFSRDFDGERRVLRIEPSQERAVECMKTSLPASANASWKEAYLAPETHRALVELLFDETRLPSYQADLNASKASGTRVCTPRSGAPDFCYVPEFVVTGDVPTVQVEVVVPDAPSRFVPSPLRFGLQPEVELSDEGQELIDAFLVAHQACWKVDD
ncbi:MAG: hypothetical protein WBN29_10330 [Polyangiales bacterium]